MKNYIGINKKEVYEFTSFYGDSSYELLHRVAMTDLELPPEQRVLKDFYTIASEYRILGSEYNPFKGKWGLEYLNETIQLAIYTLGEKKKLIQSIPIVLVPSKNTNATIIKNNEGKFAIVLDSNLQIILVHLVSFYIIIEALNDENSLYKGFTKSDYENSIYHLAAYVGTGEVRYLRGLKTLGVLPPETSLKTLKTGVQGIQIFLLLHEIGHLLNNHFDIEQSDQVSELINKSKGWKSSLEQEFEADFYALKLMNKSLFEKDFLCLNTKLLFRFRNLVEDFQNSHEISISKSHPSSKERLKNINTKLLGDESNRFKRIDLFFDELINFSPWSLKQNDKEPKFKECSYCARLVKRIEQLGDDGINVIFQDTSLHGLNCKKCKKYICIECGEEYKDNDTIWNCPYCEGVLAGIVKTPGIDYDLASIRRLDKSKAIVEIVNQYGLRGNLQASIKVFDSLIQFVRGSEDVMELNEFAKAGVTVIGDLANADDIKLSETFYNEIITLLKNHIHETEIKLRLVELNHNMFQTALKKYDETRIKVYYDELMYIYRYHYSKSLPLQLRLSNTILYANFLLITGAFVKQSEDVVELNEIAKKGVAIIGDLANTGETNLSESLFNKLIDLLKEHKEIHELKIRHIELYYNMLNTGLSKFDEIFSKKYFKKLADIYEDNVSGNLPKQLYFNGTVLYANFLSKKGKEIITHLKSIYHLHEYVEVHDQIIDMVSGLFHYTINNELKKGDYEQVNKMFDFNYKLAVKWGNTKYQEDILDLGLGCMKAFKDKQLSLFAEEVYNKINTIVNINPSSFGFQMYAMAAKDIYKN